MPRVARPTGARIARSTSQSRATSPARSLLCSFPILMPSLASLSLLLLARDTTGYWQQQVAYRITAATLGGREARPDYPYAPDSTIAHWTLARPLVPGDSLVVEVEWQARLSTLPRRQGRRGRRFDFAQWYPKVVVYDNYGWEDHPLYPGGEFYGEFATYDVTLDRSEDEVIGASGVPVEGDPGWEKAKVDPAQQIDYQRLWYRSPLPAPGCAALRVGAGRKCVRFRADRKSVV